VALDSERVSRLAGLLRDHDEQIVANWVRAIEPTLRGRLARAEVTRQVSELRDALLHTLDTGTLDLSSESATELRAVLAELSRSRARQGFTATETAISVFALKDALLEAAGGAKASGAKLQDYVAFAAEVDRLGLFTFEAYAKAREELIADQTEQLLELSTPVVKLWEGVVAVPLVGTLDSARAQVVMERLLQTLIDTESPYAIIDITGVPAVDTQVAQHILKTVMAARLMGAECIISGIRPQIAQTIVALGIEFGDIATKASLADALRHAIRVSGADGTRRTGRA
jgi:rsbT co-antagonist protein RsbR